MRKSVVAALVAAFILSGCAARTISGGNEFNMADADAIEPGTTYEAVIAKLGEPVHVRKGESGRVFAVWSYVKATTAGSKTATTSFIFTAGGVMEKRVSRSVVGST